MRRRDHARIDTPCALAPDRRDLPFLQHPEQLALERGRGIADLVEEDGSDAGQLEAALACPTRPR